ncbi:PD-(D/E)XK nuclease family protein [archaeon]|nr:PD-(D/E)XK nuclease family protein [archaeon]
MILKKAFDHSGGLYHFRFHELKLKKLNNGFFGLNYYLNDILKECPDDYFLKGPRGSSLKFKLPELNMHQIKGHEVSELTEKGLDFNGKRFKSNHMKVQVFMLENDSNTVAMEIPIWLEPDEIDNFNKIFKEEFPLTGHIDLLRIEDNKIWVWDYKPKAFNEKYAATQVFFYALMLSKRTGIDLNNFRCGYFDEDYAFIFEPKKELLDNPELSGF